MRHLLSGSTRRSIGKLFLLLMMTFALYLGLKVALEAAGNTVGASRPSESVVLADTTWSDDFDDASGLSALENVQISADGQLMLASDVLLGSAASVVISPAVKVQSWGRLYFVATVPPSTALAVDVLDATDAPLMHDVPSGGSLAGIDVSTYPALKLRATLSSTAVGQTPRLDEWRITWSPDYPNRVHLPIVGKSFGAPIPLPLGAAIGFTGMSDVSHLGKSVRFPSVRKNDASWDSSFAIQNITAFATTLTLEFFRQDGTVAYTADGVPLRPYGTYIASLADFTSLADGSYALAATATETVVGMASTGHISGTMAMAYNGISQGSQHIVVPSIYKDFYGWTSRLCIHNMTPEAAEVAIYYHGRDWEVSRWRYLSGNGVDCIDLRQEPLLPPSFVGTAHMASSTGVAVAVEDVQSSGNQALGYLGFDLSALSHTIYIPRCRKQGGWRTYIQVTNVGPSATSMTVAFHAFDGSYTHIHTYLPGQSWSIPCPDGYSWIEPPEPSPDLLGSAVVSATQSGLIALVTDRNVPYGTDSFSYPGLPTPSSTVYLPNVGGEPGDWVSTLSVQNPNTMTNLILATFYSRAGDVLYELVDDLPPYGMRQYVVTRLPGLSASYEGSAVISATMPVAVLLSKHR